MDEKNEMFVVCVFGCSVFVATWNVGGKAPPNHMNLNEWLHVAAPADIYVLGYASDRLL